MSKIILDIDKIKIESNELLNSLNNEASIKAYYLLKNIASTNDDFSVNRRNFQYEDSAPGYIEKDIIKKYQIYLGSQNKADSTIKDYVSESMKFNQYFTKEKTSITDLGIADVESYLSIRNSKKNSNSTYIKLVNCTRSFLRFLFSREYISKNLASFIKTPPKVQSIEELLSDIDIQKVKNYLEARKEKYRNENLRDNIIFYLGIDCGLRRQELINLNWEDIDFEDNSVNIIKSKGGKSRVVCFNQELNNLLIQYRRLTGNYNNALIRGAHGKRISKCSIQSIITRIFKESKTYKENLTLHSLRHTFADRLRRKGTDINTISKLMGHSSIETTAIYLHSNKEDFKRAVLWLYYLLLVLL